MPDNQMTAPGLTYAEKLSLILQANWAEYGAGHCRRIHPDLVARMIGYGDEDMIPAVITRIGPSYRTGLEPYVNVHDPRVGQLDKLASLLFRMRIWQSNYGCEAFTGISDNRVLHRYSIYYVLATQHQSPDDDDADNWAETPPLVVDWEGESKPWQYWIDLDAEYERTV